MSSHFPVPDRENTNWVECDCTQLPLDIKRMLSVQFREFIHHLEDSEGEHVLWQNPKVIKFLERCYKRAA